MWPVIDSGVVRRGKQASSPCVTLSQTSGNTCAAGAMCYTSFQPSRFLPTTCYIQYTHPTLPFTLLFLLPTRPALCKFPRRRPYAITICIETLSTLFLIAAAAPAPSYP